MNSCIVIEEEPFVIVNPGVTFQSHIRNNIVYVTATVLANPNFITPGNIPTVFNYEGDAELYNKSTGELLDSKPITGKGPEAIIEVSTSASALQNIVIIVSGRVYAYADKESDGKSGNDILLNQSDFYQMRMLSDVITLQDFPVVTVEPSVEYQSYFRGSELYTTAIITANPTFISTGIDPILFNYSGVLQIYNSTTGALVKSNSIAGSGLSTSVNIFTDTTGIDVLVFLTSGTVNCSVDIDSDGNSTNDKFITSAEFNSTQIVNLNDE